MKVPIVLFCYIFSSLLILKFFNLTLPMLSYFKLFLALAIFIGLASCDRDKQEEEVLLDGSTWLLKASVNTRSGNVQFISTSNPIEIAFGKNRHYTFTTNQRSIQATYKMDAETGMAKFARPNKIANLGKDGLKYLQVTFGASSYEIVGSSMKLLDNTSNSFLILERVK